MTDITIANLPFSDVDKVKKAVQEISNSMARATAERDLQKETINRINEEVGIDKKILRRAAKAYYKMNFPEEVEAAEKFQEFYTTVVQENDLG